MKHTDFYYRYKELDAVERTELKEAVKAHGGSFSFFNNDGEEIETGAPIVVASFKYAEEYSEYYVSKVVVDEHDILKIYGFPKESIFGISGEDILDTIEEGHISYITDYIPETEEIKDVSLAVKSNKTYVVFGRDLIGMINDDASTEELKRFIESQTKLSDVVKCHEFKTENEVKAYFMGLEDCAGEYEYQTLFKEYDSELIKIIDEQL